MSNFEYLRNITIGQYIPVTSPLQNLDARTRLLSLVCLVLALTFAVKPTGLLLGCLVLLLGYLFGRIPLSYAVRGILPPLPFLLILAVLQLFINQQTDTMPLLFSYGVISITGTDLMAACTLLIRFFALIMGLSLITFSLTITEITHSIELILKPLTRIGLATQDIVMVIQVTIRFLPILARTAEHIAKAQASRGAQWGVAKGSIIQRARQIIPLMVPLLITSIRRAENMALAMDARGFGCGIERTSMVSFKFKYHDGVVLLFILFIATGILLL